MTVTRDGVTQAMELRYLRCLVALADSTTPTDAAQELGITSTSLRRNLSALEDLLGVRLLHGPGAACDLTPVGARVLIRARRLLVGVDELIREAGAHHPGLRIGYAWSAFGHHTAEFQRQWMEHQPLTDLRLTQCDTPTGGLAEGLCDLAVVRVPTDLQVWAHALIGHESRIVAVAADHPWARRRTIGVAELASRTIAVDRHVGTGILGLWQAERLALRYTNGIDDWLDVIATGRFVGVTSQATAVQHHRADIVHRPLRDASAVPVHLIWHPQDSHPATQAAVALASRLYAG
ncbi:LysR family transcriptional regulator [Streptomyces parvulus]|uniref:LysR family transcriptional regulator n=1 Tax=Streptomyces parvulus TaxID=146923 RepID=UPI003425FDDB